MEKLFGICLFGAPGSGKDTLVEKLQKRHKKYYLIGTGELLRKKMKADARVKKMINSGELVPDKLIFNLFGKQIKKIESHIPILNGFPRTKNQAEILLKEHVGEKMLYLFILNVDDSVLIDRLVKRGREDDTKENITKRLETYRSMKSGILSIFENRPNIRIVNIDADDTFENVYECFEENIKKIKV